MDKSFKEIIKNIARIVGARFGAHLSALTADSLIGELIRSLHPVNTGINLIRLGPDSDGGYLVPDDLNSIAACFSPGVDKISGFERDCANLGMNVYMADKSVTGPAEAHQRFNFIQKYIGASNNTDFMSLDAWVEASGEDVGDLLLQMDIEGGEYEVLYAASEKIISRFRIIVVEFHWLEMLWSRAFYYLAAPAIKKLLQTHICVHIHPNNCCGSISIQGIEIPRTAEFTFLRRDRIVSHSYVQNLPHPLDKENTKNPPLKLSGRWYGGWGASE